MADGIRVTDKAALSSADSFLAVYEGTTGLLSTSALGTLLAAGGGLAAASTTDALNTRVTSLETIVTSGAIWMDPVDLLADSNITLSGEQTIDGVTTSASRVAVTGQTDASENGTYTTSSGAWARVAEMDGSDEINLSTAFVSGGTTYGGETWKFTVADPDTFVLGTDDIDAVKVGDAGSVLDYVNAQVALKLTTSNALSELAGTAEIARGNIGAAGQSDLTDTAGRINYIASGISGDGDAFTFSLADGSVGGAAVTLKRGGIVHNIPWPGNVSGTTTVTANGDPVYDMQGNDLADGEILTGDRVSLLYLEYSGNGQFRLMGHTRDLERKVRPQTLQNIDTSDPNAITADTADGNIVELYRGQWFTGEIGNGSNGPGGVTLDINGLGPVSMKEADGSDPYAGRLAFNTKITFFYDGFNFTIVSPPAIAPKPVLERLASLEAQVSPTLETAPAADFLAAATISPYAPPAGLNWEASLTPLLVGKIGTEYRVIDNPRAKVNPAIWTGPVIHVDRVNGDNGNSGLGNYYGDFSDAKLQIHAAFTAGNALGVPYRILVKAGEFKETDFTNNGNVEPTQPFALLAHGGDVDYRTGPWETTWTLDTGNTYTATISSINRMFRTDVLTAEGLYTEMTLAPDLATCRATLDTWFKDGSTVYVTRDTAPGVRDMAPIRSFHGARFLAHTDDVYIEGFNIEGGITGALHLDPEADRNVIVVGCTFRYSSPSNIANQLDAVRVRRTNGLVWFRDCDASGGAKDGWNFHEDSYPQMRVLMEGCTGYLNGWNAATSCNAFTTHDGVIAAAIGCDFGGNSDDSTGTTVHCIENTLTWLLGTTAIDANLDGNDDATAIKCSNDSSMWLEETTASATGGLVNNYAIEANGGTVYKRDHTNVAGTETAYSGGSIGSF